MSRSKDEVRNYRPLVEISVYKKQPGYNNSEMASKTAPGTGSGDTMNFNQVKAALPPDSESESKSNRNAPRTIENENQVTPMDHVSIEVPRRKLTRDHFLTPKLKALKEKADLEASLPPENAPRVKGIDILNTLRATWDTLDKADPKTIFEVVIRWPQKYSTATLQDLSRSTSRLSFSPAALALHL